MPYIKPTDPPFARVGRLLKGYGLSSGKLATVLGCSAPTALKKLKQPETLTLADLALINSRGHIPIDEIRDAIIK